ncbi:MAG: helix-turn-helix transcriptional regulator [Kiritimatiellae bacterium]|nr:helix-turn-helix transcriptional regulator [Kiritimatiellia bacterium]
MRAIFSHLETGAPLVPEFFAGVAGFAERRSTCDASRSGERVNRARNFIRLHATEGIAPPDVARHVGGTLRYLESGFRTVLGTTVKAELREARLQAAVRLLEDIETPLGEIAARVCFGTSGGLMNAFRRRFGCSMHEWRSIRRR